jgi:4-diphosphocytidyl-2-C-methyl-D-erythritol kinase
MCLDPEPCLAEGRGEVLSAAPAFPDLPTVLVNPGAASPTGPVYRAYDAAGAPGGAERPAWPPTMRTPAAVAAFLADCRNDLEAPAVRLAPVIGETLDVLRREPETLFARMSGSGATCFALCASDADRDALAARIATRRPAWWVQPCTLAGAFRLTRLNVP